MRTSGNKVTRMLHGIQNHKSTFICTSSLIYSSGPQGGCHGIFLYHRCWPLVGHRYSYSTTQLVLFPTSHLCELVFSFLAYTNQQCQSTISVLDISFIYCLFYFCIIFISFICFSSCPYNRYAWCLCRCKVFMCWVGWKRGGATKTKIPLKGFERDPTTGLKETNQS